jgi:hypothetical protein
MKDRRAAYSLSAIANLGNDGDAEAHEDLS